MTAVRSILMSADTVGGVWTYAVELAAALVPHGIEVNIASMGAPASDHQRAQIAALPNTRLFESNFKLEWMENPWNDVDCAGAWLLDLEANLRPDLIHLNHYSHGHLDWDAPVLTVGHSCVLSWWEAVYGEPAPAEWNEYGRRVRRGLQASPTVAAPSRAMLNALKRHYGPLSDTVVIPNARSADRFKPAENEPFVLAAGRLWDKAKNIEALAGIAGHIAWPVKVAGVEAGQHSGLDYLGDLSESEISSVMSRAAIYALPALYEPFGLSILEAALSGCALVLGNIPSLCENWSGAALFVDPSDPQDLQDAITSLITDSDLRERFSAAAHRRALTFTPQSMAAQYLEIFQAARACA